MVHRTVLETWSWKQRNPTIKDVLDENNLPKVAGKELPTVGWRTAQKYPSEVHVELMSTDLIPDPYIGFNEHAVQWIGHAEWLYKCIFPFNPQAIDNHKVMLEFQGLDTVCDGYLNGDKILAADNMFQTHYVELNPSTLKSSNILFLHFKSALQYAKAEEALRGRVRAGSTNLGDPSRVYLRKAQYDWRWDWASPGPELMTCGIYRPVLLSTYNVCIEDMFTKAYVGNDLACALEVDMGLQGHLNMIDKYSVVLKDSQNNVIKAESVSTSVGGEKANIARLVHWDFKKDEVKLWWPVGYGDQVLYTVELIVLNKSGIVLDAKTHRIGFRSVKLIQEPLEEPDQYGTGTTFLFEVNGVRMFMGGKWYALNRSIQYPKPDMSGSNWIPADNFLTTIAPQRYRAWLTLLRDGNQNMVRLWGGGIYEPDVFYDTCDELGLLVWQDFQFACGVYPAHDTFVASVRKEAEQNVKRLRHHPAMALFCGNNEDYQMILQWGDVKDFPAIKIYEEVLPSVVEALTDPVIPYHRGSPYGGKGWDTADPTIGDVHQWNVWGGKELPYQDYDKLGGRFVSEFGMPSMPCMKTICYWMKDADPQEFHAQSKLMAQHCRAGSFERRFAIAMNDNFKVTEDLETYVAVFNTQLMQSEAVGFAYQSWRRKWGGEGKQYTGGVLVWQSNDCWPVTSWAIADYFLRPKPVYFTIARHLATFAVGITRTVIKNKPNDRPRQFYEFGAFQTRGATLDIWAVNGSLSPRSVTLELFSVDLCSTWSHKETHAIEMPPNQAVELLSIPCPGPPKTDRLSPTGYPDWTTTSSVVVGARLLDPDRGDVLARFADWPQPYRFVDIVDPGLRIDVETGQDLNTSVVSLEVAKPAKCVVLGVVGDGEDVTWSDNALDLMPGDKQVVIARGLLGRDIQVAYLGKEKASKIL
ncbi:glycoside hydrolase [Lentinula raphanica]|uniref:Beta-mannosidase B n=1 Tax=Lentinula raphanica TaxID=153919 RepID=A0AA38PF36_9AGAR|nr:glycoside hydrolase [Lentinula raphanica]